MSNWNKNNIAELVYSDRHNSKNKTNSGSTVEANFCPYCIHKNPQGSISCVSCGNRPTVSFCRSYFYRRIFEKFGIDDNFIRLGIKGITKLKNLPSKLFR